MKLRGGSVRLDAPQRRKWAPIFRTGSLLRMRPSSSFQINAMTDINRPHNDKPISEPSDDRFGIDPFAKTLAASISKIKAPEGTVVALNGPWGSGKSSAVNLILHHLKDAIEKDEITVINFACWWFRGEEALALAFFRDLYAGLGPSLGERFKKLLPKIGARLLRAGSVVSAGTDSAVSRRASARLPQEQCRGSPTSFMSKIRSKNFTPN